ncbi:OmpW/AlkL family protein [Aliidiomarina celeris]|uniref:OmpW/AlkL family protein n=1 Tax=Aliidiomarina celeris TaxID=2249428 RepID=UPI000DE8F943|nr:OmpW family outer membrane protein [Aliidiomarina celeris]
MKKLSLPLAVFAGLALSAAPAFAELSVNVGAISVMPSDSSSSLNVVETVAGLPANSTGVSVNNNTQLGLTFDYKLNSNWAVQVIAATPFSHDISGTGTLDGLRIGETKHLPPTLMGQYYFNVSNSKFEPFVGVGINYTTFFNTKANAELVTTLEAIGATTATDRVSIKLDDSWGLALQAGFNYAVSETVGVHFMVSKIQLDTDAAVRVNGTTIEQVNVTIDPLVAMLGVRWSF